MLKERNRLFYLIRNVSILLFCLSCKKPYHGDFYIIESSKKDSDFIKLYAPDCYIYEKKNIFQIENIFHYVDGELSEVIKPSAESLIYDKFDSERSFPKRYNQYKFLSIKKNQNNILYLNSSYPIIKEEKDSIFVKTKEAKKYLIFVGVIPK